MTASLLAFLWINETRPERRRWIVGGLVLSLAMVAVAQRMVFHSPHNVLYARRIAGLAVRNQVYDYRYTRVIYPNPDELKSLAARAEASGLSIFAPNQFDYPLPPATVSASESCIGKIDSIAATATPDRFAATGWIYDPASKRYATSVVIADRDGHVLGTGLAGAQRPELASVTGSKNVYGGWTGFFRRPNGAGNDEVKAYGVLAPGQYCAVPETKTIHSAGLPTDGASPVH
jgi:hypothetical protein